jgi:hypothetical protein
MNAIQKSVTINGETPYYIENFDLFEEEFASFKPFGSFNPFGSFVSIGSGVVDFEVDGLDEKPVPIINKPIMRSWNDIMEEDEEEERREEEEKKNEDRQSLLITLNLRKILLSMGMYELEDGEVLDL